MNRLLFGDNLKWLRDPKIFPDASVDLIYLDPPFNSNADYNVLFREASGAASQAQFHAFTDTWNWADAAPTYAEFVDDCPNTAVVEMMDALHDLLETAIVGVRGQGKAGLVLIVDGLDKIAFRELEGGSNTHRRFFINGADKLASLKTHVVYTVPINLAYSPDFAEVSQTFGWTCVPVPMVRLHPCPAPAARKMPAIPGWDESASAAPAASGLKAMEKLLEKRVQAAGLDMKEVFDDMKTVELLCKITGGHPRHLLMFVRAAIGKVNKLPLTRAAVQSAIKEYAQSLGREIPGEFWPWLRHFQKPAIGFPPGLPDHVRQGMLLWLYIFEYTNGQQFYCLNPVIELLPQLHEGHGS
jgi:hypothetical protein